MQLIKKLLISTLMIGSTLLVGCGQQTTPVTTPVTTPETTPETTLEVSAESTQAINETPEVTIHPFDEASGQEVQGLSFKTKLPEGWEVQPVEKTTDEIDNLILVVNKETNDKIYIKEQAWEEADTIDMEAYMKDLKTYYNTMSADTGVTVVEAAAQSLEAINAAYMEAKVEINEALVNTSLQKGSVKQEEIDAAGGMQAYIDAQNVSTYQIFVPNRNGMITLSTTLAEGRADRLKEEITAIASIMYLL